MIIKLLLSLLVPIISYFIIKSAKNYIDKMFSSENEKKLKEMDVEKKGEFLYLSYDSPYKFYNRRNEVIIRVNY